MAIENFKSHLTLIFLLFNITFGLYITNKQIAPNIISTKKTFPHIS
jgi:uncharacterized membrane protein